MRRMQKIIFSLFLFLEDELIFLVHAPDDLLSKSMNIFK